MRIILALCGFILVAAIAIIVMNLRSASHYGGAFEGSPKVAVRDLLLNSRDYSGRKVTIEGDVIDQCPATGCFFYFDDAGQRLRIELGDLAQTLPQRAGSKAVVEGQLVPFGSGYQFLGTAVEFK